MWARRRRSASCRGWRAARRLRWSTVARTTLTRPTRTRRLIGASEPSTAGPALPLRLWFCAIGRQHWRERRTPCGRYDSPAPHALPLRNFLVLQLCNMMFMAEASRRLAASGVTVNAFSPGLIADPNGFFRNQVQPPSFRTLPMRCCSAADPVLTIDPPLASRGAGHLPYTHCRTRALPPSST